MKPASPYIAMFCVNKVGRCGGFRWNLVQEEGNWENFVIFEESGMGLVAWPETGVLFSRGRGVHTMVNLL